ncbi:IQ and ubiquitin-like domain-containing protein [Corticium candelabrum]|uniref:IQ and ubiquitin-like domain-containing protein n=1 Tax=Corticium candelabrum TaxID=121492 RepID=UPI002E25CB6A|nr:IQ and ubiquitin-like domain-containing protein [Corticium candelabrum]
MEESEDLDVNAATLKQDDIETEAEENHDGDVTNETAIQVNFGTRETNRHQENQTQVDESKDRVEESIFDDERIAQSGNDESHDQLSSFACPVTDQSMDTVEGELELQHPYFLSSEDTNVPEQPYSMPDQLTVSVDIGEETRSILVQIQKAKMVKPFIGGYRHKLTGVEYHHAATMTIPKRRPDNGKVKFQRETQTVITRNKVQQTTSATSTQMTMTGCYVSKDGDKLLVPGVYETADEFHAKRLQAVIILQSHFRRWHAQNLVNGMKEDRLRRLQWEREDQLRKEREKEERLKRNFERRMNPRTKEDFDMLFHALEMWRQEELSRINSSLFGPERKAALCQLLEKEAELIASIGRHKLVADKHQEKLQIKHLLNTAASPRKWIAFDGKTTEMDTPYTVRASELRELYQSLNMRYLTQEERMDVLLTLKATIREHDCKVTREIVELIERETDLLLRGTKQKNLEGLRKRISNLFLQYVKTPMFNPEISRLLKVPQEPTQLVHDVYFCRSTGQYLPSSDFELSLKARKLGTSRRAGNLDNVARKREDDSVYLEMLNQIRMSEEKYLDNSRVVYLLQTIDLRHLVETIWSCQSLLSQHNDLNDLVMVRWDVHHHWSPWNCVLLTKDEAVGHFRLDDITEGYSDSFIEKVHFKHVMARNYFRRLAHMSDISTGLQTEVIDKKADRTLARSIDEGLATTTSA